MMVYVMMPAGLLVTGKRVVDIVRIFLRVVAADTVPGMPLIAIHLQVAYPRLEVGLVHCKSSPLKSRVVELDCPPVTAHASF